MSLWWRKTVENLHRPQRHLVLIKIIISHNKTVTQNFSLLLILYFFITPNKFMGKFIQKSVPTTENQILFLKWFSTRIFRLNRHELKRVRARVFKHAR